MKTMPALPKYDAPAISDALRGWLDEQQVLIRDTWRRAGQRPSELVLPQSLRDDALNYHRQLSDPNPPSLEQMTAFGIPVVVREDRT